MIRQKIAHLTLDANTLLTMKRTRDSRSIENGPRNAVTSALQRAVRKLAPASDANLLTRYWE